MNRSLAFKPPGRAPLVFLGHGSPLNSVRDNEFTRRLVRLGRELPEPAAVCVVSAHWLSRGETRVGTSERPGTLHDFGGFPAELYALQYPAPGSPRYARELIECVSQVPVREDAQRELDHGAWSMLLHLWPAADVPVFQMSIDWDQPQAWHFALAQELRALRECGVLLLCSGNIVHNLGRLSAHEEDPQIAPWASEFDAWAAARLEARDFAALIDHERQGPNARLAVPTNDHYLPFVYALGALAEGEALRTLHTGFQYGSISMRCFASA